MSHTDQEYPKIFDAVTLDEEVPPGFNAVKVTIDGTLKSSLDWKEAHRASAHYIGQGLKILWEIDLGILSRLPFPLSNESQYLSLKLSLEHFCDTLWKEFHNDIVGICLYRGNVDFSLTYRWDDEQERNLQEWLKEDFLTSASSFEKFDHHLRQLYCRDAIAEYLDLLAGSLPDAYQVLLLLDASTIDDPVHLANLLSKEAFPRFHLAVKGGVLPIQEMGWEEEGSPLGYIGRQNVRHPILSTSNLAICLSTRAMFHPTLYEALRPAFEEMPKPFRRIAETHLTTEWGGLDYLVVLPESLSSQGERKLMGFCAAGGTVINLGEILGLPREIPFQDWLGRSEG